MSWPSPSFETTSPAMGTSDSAPITPSTALPTVPSGSCTTPRGLLRVDPTVPVTTLNNPRPAADDRFGYSVGVSGTHVLVGAPGDDTGANDAGSAYLYNFASGSIAIASPPLVQFAQPQANNGFLRSMIEGLPSQGTIIVESSTDLIEWQPIRTNTITGDTYELVEPISPTSPLQFYRALIRH